MSGVTPMLVLEGLAVAVLGVAVCLLVYAVGTAPQPPRERLGLRGFKRAQTLRENQAFALIEPSMRFISHRMYGLISPSLHEKLDRQIMIAGDIAGLHPEDVLSLTLMSGLTGMTLGALYGSRGGNVFVFAVILGIAGLALPHLVLSSAGAQRVRSIAQTTPAVIDLLALCLGAGLDFPAAVRQVVDRSRISDQALHEELRLLLQELHLGRTRRKALEQMAQRAPCDPVRELVSAVVQSEEQGTPLSDVLRVQAATSRMHRSTRAEEAAAKAAAKMLLPLALLFVSVLCLITGPIVLSFMAQFSS
jgi:tight adherence protein C